jgi:predicted dehydrogenase
MKDKLRVGVVGVGGIGYDQHLPGWAKVPYAEVTALADTSPEALKRASASFPKAELFVDWHELVARPDLDIVDVCTPNRLHAPVSLAALHAGKHVLCEKPLATTAAEVAGLAEASHKTGRLIMTVQQLRFDKTARQLKSLIEAGMLGEIYYSRAQWLRRRLLPARPTFTERQLAGGGAGFDIGVHVLDLACWFMGWPEPVSVSASVGAFLAPREDLAGEWGDWDRSRFEVEDFAAGLVRFANGAVLTLEASWLSFQPERELIRVQCFGTRGGLVWPDGSLVGETNRAPWDLRLIDTAKSPTPAHYDEILAFAEAIRHDTPSPIPVVESLKGIRILEAFYRSSEQKREVAVL